MKIVYTKHAEDKLKEPEAKKFGISKKLISSTVKNPYSEDKLLTGLIRITSPLDKNYSLVVVYKTESDKIWKVITFFPATKGRYESKILR